MDIAILNVKAGSNLRFCRFGKISSPLYWGVGGEQGQAGTHKHGLELIGWTTPMLFFLFRIVYVYTFIENVFSKLSFPC